MKAAIVNLITRTPLNPRETPEVRSNRDIMIVKFAKELQKQGLDIDLYISDAYKAKDEEQVGVNIIYLPTLLRRIFLPTRLPFVPALFGRLRDEYDVVICSEAFQWSTVLAVFARIFSFKKKAKIIVWHEIAKHQKLFGRIPSLVFYRVLLKYFLDSNISIYVPRSAQAKKFLMGQGVSGQKITSQIPHGIDPEVFYYDPDIKEENYIFSPSRLVFSKGVDVLLKAFAIALKRVGTMSLIIQGDGPGAEEYKELSKKLNIDKHVVICTDRLSHDAIRARYQKALMTVVASRADSFIFSLMESIACGTPVIASTNIDSHIDFMDGKGGLAFDNEDHNQLADAIVKIAGDASLRRQMRKEAVKKSKSLFNGYLYKQFTEVINSL